MRRRIHKTQMAVNRNRRKLTAVQIYRRFEGPQVCYKLISFIFTSDSFVLQVISSSLPPPAPTPSLAVCKHFVRLKQHAFKLNRSTIPVIPLPLMKEFAIELGKPFFNALLQLKILNDWREAYAPPVPRVGNPASLSDLRPIAGSILSASSV